jgi:CRP/FNR family cyclic AMP-dependent transcriptional regulator
MRPLFDKVTILAGLNEAALELLWRHVTEINIPADGVVVREGDVGNRFFLVSAGLVKVCKNFGQPNEVVLGRLGAGDFFGEMCILETLPRSATVQAMVDSSLLSLASIAFYHLYEAMPAQHSILVVNIARDLCRRLRHLDEAFAAWH